MKIQRMRPEEMREDNLKGYKRWAIGIWVVYFLIWMILEMLNKVDIGSDALDIRVFWGTILFLGFILILGYQVYGKYLREFIFVTCYECKHCAAKRDTNNIDFYYCSYLTKEYVDPKARRLCDHYEWIHEIDQENRSRRLLGLPEKE